MWHNVVFSSITDILAHIKFLFVDMKLKLKYFFIINVYSFENFVNFQIKSHVHRRSRLTQQMLPEK
jgi:hypothetical protein